MNIFLILLMSLFMTGYYMFFAPNARTPEHETEYAVARSDLQSVAECALAAHNAQIAGTIFSDICLEQHNVESAIICLDTREKIASCDTETARRPLNRYLITYTNNIDVSDYNDMMEILEKNFATSGSFGIYQEGFILAGGTSSKRLVPESIRSKINLTDGQLIYMTQYDMPREGRVFTGATNDGADIVCPAGAEKTYRFGRWQCVGYNMKMTCGGDMIWDSDLSICVPDESRKPLCETNQTAVIVDEVWECVSPFDERSCPDGLLARLNYETLEWECVEDTNLSAKKRATKCSVPKKVVARGQDGATLHIVSTTCTECEKMVLNESDCTMICVPDPEKINNPACYDGDVRRCSGNHRAFYFGFPDDDYAANVSEVSNVQIPYDSIHSQNRRFNCLDCGFGQIDTQTSLSPYVANCR